ncbi:alpha-D-ribose 1-methylphosphonate 5-triphosphate synthase subunit PhnH [Rhodopseudomonas thermotolerans]|uniref:Alpha-D-ribose 1-methylphosphonate 5-triphosphate synthase subunit PhnH n=2 Tax=Rhodopseudomonas TaxID=1073 RepID=A0A336JJC9_9BRAD|nr:MULTISPECIES: phosphonate C-P lyase system protein PhnH [Rhodopseudomonas]RED38385.1 alpha-D-ribose 1-methylphosphonate 5-triphosphate synthase subunit PhnH [Rhodopseudomonas pentothenatexigens]REG05970.1 alpha-D-ribose 1-methylphosphonate 5-triphosphate synthase subunit PhnH [Rhodopseudomonas thermotolerans]SSW89838.1 alpha-D-ribose 1-methylphosphonate 5-triphosphate synthase subunit PhnH [Rhodopseudomonas pentothenatexigens]
MTTTELATGFADKVLGAQSTFRAVMEAMARPGRIQRISTSAGTPAPLMHASAALALTLLDHDTPIWLDDAIVADGTVARWLKFHTGAPLTDDPSAAAFALIGNGAALLPLERFALGTPEYPDRSTTLIVQVQALGTGDSFRLHGPGIDGETLLQAVLQPADLFGRLNINAALFPRGIDVVLVSGDQMVAIPRTTRLSQGS